MKRPTRVSVLVLFSNAGAAVLGTLCTQGGCGTQGHPSAPSSDAGGVIASGGGGGDAAVSNLPMAVTRRLTRRRRTTRAPPTAPAQTRPSATDPFTRSAPLPGRSLRPPPSRCRQGSRSRRSHRSDRRANSRRSPTETSSSPRAGAPCTSFRMRRAPPRTRRSPSHPSTTPPRKGRGRARRPGARTPLRILRRGDPPRRPRRLRLARLRGEQSRLRRRRPLREYRRSRPIPRSSGPRSTPRARPSRMPSRRPTAAACSSPHTGRGIRTRTARTTALPASSSFR
jgi:hypothetical protein